jgi:ribosomal protein S18 acetylase RimI-like enzyme
LRTFSEITDQDLAQVTELWERRTSSRATGNVTEYIAAGRKPPSSILIGKKGGEVVCGAMVGFTGQRGWINDICVDERFQRRGFGRAIVAAAETWLTERGAPNIRLKVPYTHLAVIGFYDKLGYRFQHTVVLGKLVQAGAHDAMKLELL